MSPPLPTSLGAIVFLAACSTEFADPGREVGPAVADGAAYPTEVHTPTTLGVVDTPLVDVNGTPIGVACATCHGPDADSAWAARPGEPFHTGTELDHGDLACDACHDPADRGRLHLADGRSLELGDTMQLCAQCHGPKFTTWQNGAHGGMNGYWDTRRGPRLRNHCVDCHAPHAPQIAPVTPMPRAHDRGLHGEE